MQISKKCFFSTECSLYTVEVEFEHRPNGLQSTEYFQTIMRPEMLLHKVCFGL